MGWFITGNRKGLVLGVSDTGLPICHGSGAHDPKSPGLNDFGGNIDHTLLQRIQQAECGWTIVISSESELHIDGNGEGLFAQVQQSPEKSHGMIKFYAHSPDVVAFMVVVPQSAFVHIRQLFELVTRAHPWDYMNPELPKFPEMPPLPDLPLLRIQS
jgi:hypothetical protein